MKFGKTIFLSSQNYELGEPVQVVLNYKKEDSLALPASAKVVRQDQLEATFKKGIAIQLME